MNRSVLVINRSPIILLLFAALLLTFCNLEKKESSAEKHFADERKFPAGFVLTFDDAYIKQWTVVNALLDSFDVKATFFVEGAGELTDEQLKQLQILNEEGHEIGVHTESHADVPKYIREYGADEFMRREIKRPIERLKQFGIVPTSFSYPHGYNNSFTDSLLLTKFKLLRDVTEAQRHWYDKYFTEPRDLDEIYVADNRKKVIEALGIDRKFEISKLQLHDVLKRAKNQNSIVVFYAHQPVKGRAKQGSYQISFNYLRYLFSTAEMFGLKSYLFSELSSINNEGITETKKRGN